MQEFRWNDERSAVALALAKGESVEAAAKAHDLNPATIWRWRRHPEFEARIAEEAERIRAAIRNEGIASKQNRIDELNDRHRRLKRVIEQRARRHPELADSDGDPAPGADTGLMVRTVRYMPGGVRVEEWGVDVAMLKHMLDLEKQAAQEMGQWTEKSEATVKTDGAIEIRTVVVEMPADDDGGE